MAKLKMVIFDMDGLLLDTEQLYNRGWLEVAKRHQVPLGPEDIRNWGGQSSSQTMDKLMAIFGDEKIVLKLKAEREKFIQAEMANGNLKVKPYAREVLQLAKDLGLKVGLATSTLAKRGNLYLDHFDLRQYFDVIVFGDAVDHLKPAPDIYLEALKQGGATADQAIAAEDSFYGVLAATNAGIPVCFVPDESLPRTLTKDERAQLDIILEGPTLQVLADWLKQNKKSL